jgi:high affinity Mn2+ porin
VIRPSRRVRPSILVLWCVAAAGVQPKRAFAEEPIASGPTTFFPHPDDARWWLSGQVNIINQAHPGFPAAYDGPNSLSAQPEDATSFVATLYAGYQLTSTTEILVDVESAGGGGISDALGVAGFTNLDVVRNPQLGAAPYLARAEIHQIIPLTDDWTDADRGPLGGFRRLPARRLELRAGKLSTVDVFDTSSVGSDSHLQFMNWAVDNDGAYDYAADTRGYTLGVVIEYRDRGWAARLGELLMPTVANGIDYDFDVAHARGENLELELRPEIGGRHGAIRLLGFLNHARMGSYAEAIAAFLSGQDPRPDIAAHRAEGRIKYGVGLNLEQEISASLRIFARAGWNDGATESFAYTEVDDTLALGLDHRGAAWRRPGDKVGLALVTSGLSRDHRTYLSLGGQGFLLGDGALDYGRETIVEAYYTAHLWRGWFPALDVQVIANPGYNRARGPVLVASLRLHLEL